MTESSSDLEQAVERLQTLGPFMGWWPKRGFRHWCQWTYRCGDGPVLPAPKPRKGMWVTDRRFGEVGRLVHFIGVWWYADDAHGRTRSLLLSEFRPATWREVAAAVGRRR